MSKIRIKKVVFFFSSSKINKYYFIILIIILLFSLGGHFELKFILMAPIRKKNGEVKLCIDFRNLNKVSLKDNYPLPKMEHILQKVVGSERISTMDGFSGYNQVKVLPKSQEKTAFTTPWGTFMYDNIPFGLMNVGDTFQCAMDIAFVEEKDKFVVVYMDDITVQSISDTKHIRHLEKVFLKCKKYGISLNPKK